MDSQETGLQQRKALDYGKFQLSKYQIYLSNEGQQDGDGQTIQIFLTYFNITKGWECLL